MNASIIISSPDDIVVLSNRCKAILESRGPQEVIIKDLDHSRSNLQNRLAFHWYKYAAVDMGDEIAEDKRAYCKLHFGVPIRREDEAFREVYDRVIRPLTYEQKLEIMVGAIDFPVTRDMKVKEMSRYLEAMEVHYAGIGVILPKPEDLYYGAMGIKRR